MSSIRRKLALQLSLALALLFLATGVGVSLAMRQQLYAGVDAGLAAKADVLAAAVEVDDDELEVDSMAIDLGGFGKGRDYYAIHRIGSGRALEASTGHTGDLTLPEPGADAAMTHDGMLDGDPARFFLRRFRPRDDEDGRFRDLYLAVGTPVSGIVAQLGLLTTIITIAGAVAIAAVIVIVGIALKRGLRPLGKLSADLREIQPGQLDYRLATGTLPEELKPVGESLNSWLARLQASFERERRFSSHAAHELRTPLAELKTMTELGSMFPEEATQERFTEMLGVTNELAALLEKLSLLARTEAGRQPLSIQPIELAASVNQAIERAATRAGQRGIRFDSAVRAGPFTSDPVLWSSILQNLVSNAANYAPEGTTVNIAAAPGSFSIANAAPDLTGTDVERLFERFWRKDASRTGYEHSGLGLSIVQAAATALGGTCRASLSPDRVLTIEVITSPEKASSPAP